MQKILQSFHYCRNKKIQKKETNFHFIYFMKDVHMQWMDKSIYHEQHRICDQL